MSSARLFFFQVNFFSGYTASCVWVLCCKCCTCDNGCDAISHWHSYCKESFSYSSLEPHRLSLGQSNYYSPFKYHLRAKLLFFYNWRIKWSHWLHYIWRYRKEEPRLITSSLNRWILTNKTNLVNFKITPWF